MAEAGCLRDAHFQNLEVSGKAIMTSNSLNFKRNIIALTNASASVTRTLLVDESGSIVTLNNNQNSAYTIDITLPSSNQVGTTYELHFLTNPQHDDADVTITTGSSSINIAGVFNFADGVAGDAVLFEGLSSANGISKLTIDATNIKTTLDGVIRLTSVSSTLWRIDASFPNIADPHVDNLIADTATATANSLLVTSASA